jgi:tetratricopeptide (TPR) repeat protein
MLRRVAIAALIVFCLAGVVAYQATRSPRVTGDPHVFVPSPRFYEDLSGTYGTSIADAYWLYTVQYYGEHLKSDNRFDALPEMLDVITTLSPHFKHAYFFGAVALLDYGSPKLAYTLLERGFRANPTDWHFPFYLGFLVYTYADNKDKALIAARWYDKAAKLPGRLPTVPRLAAALYQKGHEREKAMALWAQVYGEGDKYAQQKAMKALDELLPRERIAREKAVAGLKPFVTPDRWLQLVTQLMAGY